MRIIGTNDDDKLVGTKANDNIFGLNGNDTLFGENGDDELHGGGDKDNLKGGGGDDTLFGGAGDDLLFGGSGADVLRGGLGVNHLTGGEGADRFVFDDKPDEAKHLDHITDFQPKKDMLELLDTAYASLKPGKLAAAHFHLGNAATNAMEFIIYNPKTGDLFYDPDGNGPMPQVKFAVLDNHAALTAADIFVF
jgi:Ca2+-binding RTX toxin-like protein